MARVLLRRVLLGLLAVSALACLARPALACPFCTMQGVTLTKDVGDASMVLYGTLSNAKPDGDGGGTTDFAIEEVVKEHAIRGDKKVLTVNKFLPPGDAKEKLKFLLLFDVFKGKTDLFRLVVVKDGSDIVKYLQGALKVRGESLGARLRFFFDYLDNADIEISNDAYKEFGNADYKDYRDMAKKLPADKIAKWLEDPNTPAFRYGLYASMLGHCGTEKHGELLRKMLDDPKVRAGSGVDGVFAGYVMLKPKDGWKYLRGVLADPKQEFMVRYAALRSIRFFWESRPDVIDKKQLVEGVALLLDDGTIADLAIEDLRKWQRWEVCDRVLGLFGKKSHDVPIVRRSILRYALSCPAAKAEEFVKEQRQKDKDWVNDVEELLRLETGAANKPASASK